MTALNNHLEKEGWTSICSYLKSKQERGQRIGKILFPPKWQRSARISFHPLSCQISLQISCPCLAWYQFSRPENLSKKKNSLWQRDQWSVKMGDLLMLEKSSSHSVDKPNAKEVNRKIDFGLKNLILAKHHKWIHFHEMTRNLLFSSTNYQKRNQLSNDNIIIYFIIFT